MQHVVHGRPIGLLRFTELSAGGFVHDCVHVAFGLVERDLAAEGAQDATSRSAELAEALRAVTGRTRHWSENDCVVLAFQRYYPEGEHRFASLEAADNRRHGWCLEPHVRHLSSVTAVEPLARLFRTLASASARGAAASGEIVRAIQTGATPRQPRAVAHMDRAQWAMSPYDFCALAERYAHAIRLRSVHVTDAQGRGSIVHVREDDRVAGAAAVAA